jgi:hypothetical protein
VSTSTEKVDTGASRTALKAFSGVVSNRSRPVGSAGTPCSSMRGGAWNGSRG